MHKIIVLLATAVCYANLNAIAQTCCQKPLASIALEEEFKVAHPAPPMPYTYTASKGSMVTFKTRDKKEGRAYFIPSANKTDKVLLVFHEWRGLTDHIKQEAEKLHKDLRDVDVYAIDLYDGQIAKTTEQASEMMAFAQKNRGMAIVDGLLGKVGKKKKIATLGWCIGGTWALGTSVAAGTQAAACVMYYGFAEADKNVVAKIKTDVLYLYATEDKLVGYDAITEMGEVVKAAGKEFRELEFETDHEFANPENPKYNKAVAIETYNITMGFLYEKLFPNSKWKP